MRQKVALLAECQKRLATRMDFLIGQRDPRSIHTHAFRLNGILQQLQRALEAFDPIRSPHGRKGSKPSDLGRRVFRVIPIIDKGLVCDGSLVSVLLQTFGLLVFVLLFLFRGNSIVLCDIYCARCSSSFCATTSHVVVVVR